MHTQVCICLTIRDYFLFDCPGCTTSRSTGCARLPIEQKNKPCWASRHFVTAADDTPNPLTKYFQLRKSWLTAGARHSRHCTQKGGSASMLLCRPECSICLYLQSKQMLPFGFARQHCSAFSFVGPPRVSYATIPRGPKCLVMYWGWKRSILVAMSMSNVWLREKTHKRCIDEPSGGVLLMSWRRHGDVYSAVWRA